MRLFTALFIVALLLWNLGGSTACWQVVRQSHRTAQRTGRSGRGSDTLVVSAIDWQNLCWPQADEVIYKGRYFDVDRVEHTQTGFRIIGRFDAGDDGLARELVSLWQRHDHKEGPGKMPPIFTIEAILTSGVVVPTAHSFYGIGGNKKAKHRVVFYAAVVQGPVGPPPKA